MAAKTIDYAALALQAGQIFNPNTPVSEKDLFSGRKEQIRRVLDVVVQRGQHGIIFGERGVGKTSLANVLSSFVSNPSVQSQLISTRINCIRGDDFTTVWRKLFDEMQLHGSHPGVGFMAKPKPTSYNSATFFPNPKITSDDVRRALIQISQSFMPVLIIDEFDRLHENVRKIFADLIKSLSDYALTATIILIGVGDSVDEIIHEHQSVSRALVQIQMPRMQPDEIKAIIITSVNRLGMTINDITLQKISLLSKGLPHYTHLIGLHATRDALDNHSLVVTDENLAAAIQKGIRDAQHSIKTGYFEAIRSSRKDSLFADVLLSCALAEVNELGEFAAQDIREPMYKVTRKAYNIPAFAQHLNDFSEKKRANILIKSGEKRRFRYKFADPLMQPFIIMQGILDGKITPQSLV